MQDAKYKCVTVYHMCQHHDCGCKPADTSDQLPLLSD